MLNVALVILGWSLVALTAIDVFRTVLWSGQGGGPITGAVTWTVRRGLMPIARRNRIVLSALGPIALLSIIVTWTWMLLVGFTLTFQMDPDAVVRPSTGEPVSWSERAYAVGYNVFTLGNGDLAPSTDLMRAMFVVTAATGLFLMTVSVTYLVPVIGASVTARSFASSVLSLGDSPAEVVVGAWDGDRIRLDHQLRQWDQQLSLLGHQHLAYPVLHLFASADPQASAPGALACVDDVLTLLDAVEPAVAPPRPERRMLRSSVQRYVRTYGEPIDEEHPPPAPPDLSLLRAAGIPLRTSEDELRQMADALAEHRSRVHQIAERASKAG